MTYEASIPPVISLFLYWPAFWLVLGFLFSASLRDLCASALSLPFVADSTSNSATFFSGLPDN